MVSLQPIDYIINGYNTKNVTSHNMLYGHVFLKVDVLKKAKKHKAKKQKERKTKKM